MAASESIIPSSMLTSIIFAPLADLLPRDGEGAVEISAQDQLSKILANQ